MRSVAVTLSQVSFFFLDFLFDLFFVGFVFPVLAGSFLFLLPDCSFNT